MFDRIIAFALRNRLFVGASATLLVIYGTTVVLHLPVDVLPDLNRPTVTVMTEAPGLAPEEVETLVTFPIETTLNGAPGVERVRATSGIGLSVITVEFAWGTDIYRDRQLVNEKLALAAERLPAGIVPAMGPVSSIMGEIMLLGLVSRAGVTSPPDMRALADWTIRQRLLTIPGVSQVIPIGGGVKQYQVLVHPQQLAALGLSLDQVERAVAESNDNTSGGYLETRSQEFLVRNLGRLSTVADVTRATIVTRNGLPVTVGRVASVAVGVGTKRGDASVNAHPAVILSIQKQPGASTIDLTRHIHAAMRELRTSLPPDVEMRPLFEQARFIEASITNVEEALRDGAILVLIVLYLFLLNLRTTAITITAIPLSFVTAAVVMHRFGISINTMTLGGLAVAIGELVDDAIVNVENVFRRLRENRQLPNPRPALNVVFAASSEVRNSIVYATILVVLVFLPLFALSGIEGKLFAPLGVAYIVSILASFVVSLTVTPVLCYFLLPRAKVMEHRRDGPLVRTLKRWDRALLARTLPHAGWVAGGALVLVLLAAALVPLMGTEFLPPFNEGTATINVIAVPGTSLEESDRLGTIAEQMILGVPEVLSTGRRTGRAELDEHAEGVHSSEIDVDFRHGRNVRSQPVVLEDIRRRLSAIPGVSINIGQPISHRLDHLLSGVRAQIAVKLFGNDLDVLRQKAAEIETVMRAVPGVVDLQTEKQVLIPQVRIRPDRDALARYGLSMGELTRTLETALAGRTVSSVLEGQRSFDLVVRYDAAARANADAIRATLVDTPSGAQIPLGQIAIVEQGIGPNVIQHENMQRRIVVSCNVHGRDLGRVVRDIEATVAQRVKLPSGYFVTYGGQFESQQEATRTIALLSLFSLTGMFLVLFSHFRSVPIVLQILLNIPLALVGSVIAIFLTGGTFSVATLVGFITLTGIASRNTIMMISHYLHLMAEEGETFSKQMIVRGSLERLVPVLMTALTAGLGLIPLVLAKDQPGKEILYPVATVILGGLISSTLLDMVVTPAVFYRFGRKSAERYLAHHTERSI
jgi:CzcA family heavy metal efflux pump